MLELPVLVINLILTGFRGTENCEKNHEMYTILLEHTIYINKGLVVMKNFWLLSDKGWPFCGLNLYCHIYEYYVFWNVDVNNFFYYGFFLIPGQYFIYF